MKPTSEKESAMNTVSLYGRLTGDPRTATFEKGTTVTRLRLAVRRPLANGNDAEPDFFDVQAWGSLGAAAERLRSGQPIGVSGRLRQHTQTTEAGDRRDRVYVVADWIDFPPHMITRSPQPAATPEPIAA
jgi:single stranded DNA-binding protein